MNFSHIGGTTITFPAEYYEPIRRRKLIRKDYWTNDLGFPIEEDSLCEFQADIYRVQLQNIYVSPEAYEDIQNWNE